MTKAVLLRPRSLDVLQVEVCPYEQIQAPRTGGKVQILTQDLHLFGLPVRNEDVFGIGGFEPPI